MGLAFIVIEEHTWRTMQLGNNHSLGTVNDERAVFRHQRHFAHVYFLLFNIFDCFVRRLFVVNDQANFDTQRGRIGHTAKNTFFYIKRGFAKAVTHVLKCCVSRKANDGKYRFEGGMQAQIISTFGTNAVLQKAFIRVYLNRQKIRHIHDGWQSAKFFTNTLFLCIRVGHLYSPV